MNNYHDLVDRKRIQEAIISTNIYGNESRPFYGKTLEEAVEIWKNKAIKTPELISVLQVYRDNEDLLSGPEDIELLDALISHPENGRLRLIGDGSFYTHRIWAHITSEGKVVFTPEIDYEIARRDSAFSRMRRQMQEHTPAQQVGYLFDNFEVVYIQPLSMSTTRDEIVLDIRRESFYRLCDFYDDL